MYFKPAGIALLVALTVIKLLVVSTTGIQQEVNDSLIVSIPPNDCIGSQDTNLNEEHDILTAAQAAVNGINNDSSILSNHDLQLIVLDGCKDENEILQQFVNATYYQLPQSVRGLTGFFSHKAISLLLPLITHKRIALTLPSEVYVYRNQGRGIVTANSPTTMANVLLMFVKRMNWKRFGLITESTDLYFYNVAVSLLQIAKVNKTVVVSPYIELHSVESAINEIISYNTKIIIVSLPARSVAKMIHQINEIGLLWPDYAWIFLNHNLHDELVKYEAMRGMLMIKGFTLTSTSTVTFREQGFSRLPDVASKNPFKQSGLAEIMYDIVTVTALKIKNCMDSANHVSTHCQEPLITTEYSHDTLFGIFHIWERSTVLIGNIYSNFSITIMNETVLELVPIDDLPVISIDPPTGYTISMVSLIILLVIFTTLVLLFYLCFHKEPEIKATSFTISLFLFVGCYFNLVYIILIVYFEHPAFNAHSTQHQNAICNLFLWFSGTGISMPLMLATLLVKLLRVYHIFNHITLRVGHYFSDLVLTIYILVILAPNIIVNLIWVFVDQYHAVIEFKARKGYIQLSKDCSSNYANVWLGVLCAYLLLLALASAVVAIRTRKVRMEHFKDTKKVNILVFSLCFGLILTFSYWLLFYAMNTKPYVISIPLIIGHSLLILFFQSLLFIPKVFPPFCRYISYNRRSTSVISCTQTSNQNKTFM